jgi:hypothetical protein
MINDAAELAGIAMVGTGTVIALGLIIYFLPWWASLAATGLGLIWLGNKILEA